MTWTTPVRLSDAYGAAVLADSPRGYWKLDSNLLDFSGNHQNAGGYGSYTFGLGAYSGGITFDGTSGYLAVVDSASVDLGDVLTIEAWVKPTTNVGDHDIVNKGLNAYMLRLSGGLVQAVKEGFTGLVVSTIQVPVDGAWHHVVWTKNGATHKIYIDAVDRTGAVTDLTLANNTIELRIGRRSELAGGGSYWAGGLDEVAVYPTALSSARVTAHFNARSTATGALSSATWNTQVADNLDHLHTGKLFYLPTPSEDLTANGKVHGFRDGAYCIPVINKDVGTLLSMAYRSDTANGKIDMGIYLDDGNGTTCSKISTTGLQAMPGGAGSKRFFFAQPAVVTSYQKYWLVMGFAITKSGSGGKLGTVLGTDGPTVLLARRAVNVMPLPTIITFDAVRPTVYPVLAAFP